MVRDYIQENLVHTGRTIIKEKGAEFLTARKLSEASGYSVGTIYNQFGNMDNFILYVLFDIVVKYMTEHSEVIRKLCEIIWGVFFKPFMQEIAKILADRLLKRGKKNACRKKSENKKGKEKACKEKNDDRKLEDE